MSGPFKLTTVKKKSISIFVQRGGGTYLYDFKLYHGYCSCDFVISISMNIQ